MLEPESLGGRSDMDDDFDMVDQGPYEEAPPPKPKEWDIGAKGGPGFVVWLCYGDADKAADWNPRTEVLPKREADDWFRSWTNGGTRKVERGCGWPFYRVFPEGSDPRKER